MRRFALFAFSLATFPILASAGPTAGFFRNPAGPSVEIKAATDQGFDFGLTAGASDGSYTCPEGEVDCLHVEGHADLKGKFFAYVDPSDDTSRIFFQVSDAGVKVVSTTGPLGTGTANRAAMVSLPGLYAPEFLGDDVEGDPSPDQAPDQTANQGTSDQNAPDQPASSGDELHFFKSPSGNISCLFDLGDSANVRCDMAQLNRSFTTKPADCVLDWGDSFGIGETDTRGAAVCHGDTVISPDAEVLAYGGTLSYFGIACTASKAGMTCQNNGGHGFTLSRKQQSLF